MATRQSFDSTISMINPKQTGIMGRPFKLHVLRLLVVSAMLAACAHRPSAVRSVAAGAPDAIVSSAASGCLVRSESIFKAALDIDHLLTALSQENVEHTVRVIETSFSYDAGQPHFRSIREEFEGLVATGRSPMYWVYQDPSDPTQILAGTGIYRYPNEPTSKAWLHWFFVSPKLRGKGLGSKMLAATIEKAKSSGIKELHIHTSTIEEEAAAQRLYESFGFSEYSRKPSVSADGRHFETKFLFRTLQ
jgi:GNAT superfamily N-acetyltransferase